jgi:hypothetical protein
MPTRITSQTATLIDHIYYHESKITENLKIKIGSFTSDISDHLPNYLLLINDKKKSANDRSIVPIYSAKNTEAFTRELQGIDWNLITGTQDANEAYNKFIETLLCAFNRNFKYQKLSRKRVKDKIWITAGLKKSSRIKNILHKKWILT